MAFTELFDDFLTSTRISLGAVNSNVFIVQSVAFAPWVKVRIGIYTQIPDVGIVEISNAYLPVGDDRLIMGIAPMPEGRYAPPFLAFAEVIYRYPPGNPYPCKIFFGDVEDMIYDSVNASVIAEANATKSEISSDIINASANAVVSAKAANPNRTGGFLSWSEAGTIYIGFGAAPQKKPTSALAKGSRIAIPDGFVGEIFVDWNGNQVAVNAPAATFKTLHLIEYIR